MLDQLDKSIFLFLNSFHSEFWDEVMWVVSEKLTWIPLYIAILVYIGISKRYRLLVIFPVMILTVVLTDQVSVHCFKEVFERLRPCHEPSLEGLVHIVNGKCGGKFGFVSSHAANTFGIATISLFIIRRRCFTIFILLWAGLVSYSRVYLGVHYPGDILGGAIVGILLGLATYYLYSLVEKKYLSDKRFFNIKPGDADS